MRKICAVICLLTFIVISAKDKHESVDLGLSVKWATTNVGAETPDAFGDYFCYGESEVKPLYLPEYYTADTNLGNISGTKYDPARTAWGGGWRMPTMEELRELKEKCIWNHTSINGTDGWRVTGINGNSIFLPAAGYRYREWQYYIGVYGFYLSGTAYPGKQDCAWSLLFYYDYRYDLNWYYRNIGIPVRPVK